MPELVLQGFGVPHLTQTFNRTAVPQYVDSACSVIVLGRPANAGTVEGVTHNTEALAPAGSFISSSLYLFVLAFILDTWQSGVHFFFISGLCDYVVRKTTP